MRWLPQAGTMKVLFVCSKSFNPKQTYREYPLGVGYLATVLQELGHETAIFDQCVEGREDALLWHSVRAFAPDVVGFSIITPNYPVAKEQIEQVRRLCPGTFVIAGGIHPTLFPDDLLADGAHVVVLGEGEETLPQLLDALSRGDDLATVDGLAFRDRDGCVVRTRARQRTVAFDDIPMVDRRLYNLPQYTHHSMLASRGCPYKCTFCCNYTGTIMGKGLSLRGYVRVVEEMKYLEQEFHARQIFFADDIFLLKRNSILDFCSEVKRQSLHLSWIGQMRVDTINDEVAASMSSANCKRIYFGVESGSDAILARVNKKITTQSIRRGIDAAKRHGIRVKTGWIYGLPGTLDEQYESIALMRQLRPHEISVHQLIPFPGTEYYNHPDAYGIRIHDRRDFRSFCYGGLGTNVSFDYLTVSQYMQLLVDTVAALEADGYVSSDRAASGDEYIYTTPLCAKSLVVFRNDGKVASDASPFATLRAP
jgi:anaerobic magnesium-protoporphyrin IX monomethyl ester cyclase